MISHLTGTIVLQEEKFVILDVGGVGYKIFASPDTLHAIHNTQHVSLWVHLSVREQSLDLYGFKEVSELDFFEMIIGVSGIGPKSGLGILSVAPVGTLIEAISTGDTSYLKKVSGIGKKSAEKIVLELRDSLKLARIEHTSQTPHRKEASDAIDALVALGYSTSDARDALKEVSPDITGAPARIKEALKIIGTTQ